MTLQTQHDNEHRLYKIVHSFGKTLGDLSETSVTLNTLKATERALVKKELLPKNSAFQETPIWFLAETERNVFLWRNGLSLTDSPNFEFWFDPIELASRQLGKLLERPHSDERAEYKELPGLFSGNISNQQESISLDYLERFVSAWKLIGPHLHALSLLDRRADQLNKLSLNDLVIPLPYIRD